VIEDPALGEQAEQMFLADLENSKEVGLKGASSFQSVNAE
jgi:hypothetical protein